MHLNQQLDAPHEHFCASDYKEFEPEIFSYTTTHYCWVSNLKIFGALGILSAIFRRTYLLYAHFGA